MDIYQKTRELILNTLFPIACLNCDRDGIWLCPECLEKIHIHNFQICPRCEKIITEQGKICPNCQKYVRKNPFYLNNLVSATKYKDNNISRLIKLLKYNFLADLSLPLGEILRRGIVKSDLPLPDFIVPVPLHPRRLRWRGFNQAELLAKYLSSHLAPGFEIPLLQQLLQRKRYTPPQAEVKKFSERKLNLQNVFSISPELSAKIKNKKILLVDDIATTATTLLECAKVLKNNGAKKVSAAVIARQEFEK